MRLFRKIPAAVLPVLLVGVLAVVAHAQVNQPGSGLSISPLHNQLSLLPGESKDIELTLKNITSGPVVARAYVNDFTSDNLTGNPVIITDTSKLEPTSIQRFVEGLANVPLSVGEQKKVSLTINVPSDVAPGAYYGIIRYQAIPVSGEEAGDGQVSLSASVGTIVLVEIEGDLVKRLQLLGLKVYSGQSQGTLFFSKPDQIGVELKNLGNGFVQPFGKVVIENFSGREVSSVEVNNVNPRANVLPGSQRLFKDKIKLDSFGRYKATASISHGPGGEVLVSQKTFWYIPLWLFALIILVAAALLVATFFAWRRFKRSRRGFRKHPR